MEVYCKEIEDRRENFGRFTEVIHARVNILNKFEYLLVGFEKITQQRKNINLNVDNIRARAKSISKR